jgi:hypothetical protein
MLSGNLAEKVGGFGLLIVGAILKALGFLLAMLGGLLATAGSVVGDLLMLPGRSASRKDETREMLLSDRPSPGVEPPWLVLRRASSGTKLALLENVLAGRASADDQRAALVVLRSARDPKELAALAEPFGGPEALSKHFSGERAAEARALFGL